MSNNECFAVENVSGHHFLSELENEQPITMDELVDVDALPGRQRKHLNVQEQETIVS